MTLNQDQKKIFFVAFMSAVVILSVGTYLSFRVGLRELRRAEDLSQDIVVTLKPYKGMVLEGEARVAMAQCYKENPYRVGNDIKAEFCQCYAVNGDPLKAMMSQDFMDFSAYNQALMRACRDDVIRK